MEKIKFNIQSLLCVILSVSICFISGISLHNNPMKKQENSKMIKEENKQKKQNSKKDK